MSEIIGNIFMTVGLVFICAGVYGTFWVRDFYARLSVTSQVDTIGFMAILIGIMIKSGLTLFSGKVLIILFLYMLTNPVSAHSIARSAYVSGYRTKKERRLSD